MAKEYEVLGINEMMRTDDVGKIERYYRARIKTKGGTVLTVNLEEEEYTAEKAGPILLAAAQNSDKIRALTG